MGDLSCHDPRNRSVQRCASTQFQHTEDRHRTGALLAFLHLEDHSTFPDHLVVGRVFLLFTDGQRGEDRLDRQCPPLLDDLSAADLRLRSKNRTWSMHSDPVLQRDLPDGVLLVHLQHLHYLHLLSRTVLPAKSSVETKEKSSAQRAQIVDRVEQTTLDVLEEATQHRRSSAGTDRRRCHRTAAWHPVLSAIVAEHVRSTQFRREHLVLVGFRLSSSDLLSWFSRQTFRETNRHVHRPCSVYYLSDSLALEYLVSRSSDSPISTRLPSENQRHQSTAGSTQILSRSDSALSWLSSVTWLMFAGE